MIEVFVKPAVSAIIEKVEEGKRYILLQRRQKGTDDESNGLIEVVGGKIREYENIFDALRREVREETGLTITEICGESEQQEICVNGTKVIGFQAFCTVQNLNGIYSLIMQTFICHAEGEPSGSTNETVDVHWESVEAIKELLTTEPQKIFPLDVLPLKKYIEQL
jgi:8-oxo-dGTP diphosphatase